MPKQASPKFRRDVVEVAVSSGPTQAQVAHDFGISENTV
jgi:transposase-like protein